MNGGWVSSDNKSFEAANYVKDSLAPGIYSFWESNDARKFFVTQEFPSDAPAILPGLPTEYITEQIRLFWSRAEIYKNFNFIHKRGILLYGPPGCGKTSIIRILCDEILKNNGVVFSISNFNVANRMVPYFREREPNRPIMTLMEDIEGVFKGDAGPGQIQAALSFLDGQDQINNVVHVATTNEPEQLADRFIKRPGRFDLVIGVHAPKAETREAYLRYVCGNKIPDEKLIELVQKTEGLGLSYLRELASTYLCLDVPLDETLARLHKNFNSKSLSNKKKQQLGFTLGYQEEFV